MDSSNYPGNDQPQEPRCLRPWSEIDDSSRKDYRVKVFKRKVDGTFKVLIVAQG